MNELFAKFFANVTSSKRGFFEDCRQRPPVAARLAAIGTSAGAADDAAYKSGSRCAERVVLPAAAASADSRTLAGLKTFGRIMASALLNGRRVGCELAPRYVP